MTTVGEGQPRDRIGIIAILLGKEVVRRGEGGEKNTLTDLPPRRTLDTLTINETFLSQNAQNTFISQCPNHYHLEYAFILNFDLNKKSIKKHISSWIFLLRESYGGKGNV